MQQSYSSLDSEVSLHDLKLTTKHAARAGDLAKLKELIKKKVEIHNWALFEACKYGHLDCASYIIQKFPNYQIHDKCMDFAAHNGHMKVLKFLYKCKSKENADYKVPPEVLIGCLTPCIQPVKRHRVKKSDHSSSTFQNKMQCLQYLKDIKQVQITPKVIFTCFQTDNVKALKMLISVIKDFKYEQWLFQASIKVGARKCYLFLCDYYKKTHDLPNKADKFNIPTFTYTLI